MDSSKANLDPIEVARLLAGVFLSQQVAAVVGPYAVIILAGVAGAAFKMSNRKSQGFANSLIFFFACVMWSMLVTVPLATFLASTRENWSAQWFFVPCAAFLAYTADRLKDVAAGAVEAAKIVIRNWAAKDSP